MPNWKKLVVSGSDAALNSLYVNTSVTASVFSGSQFTGSLFGTASWARNSLTASYFLTSSVTSASFAGTASNINGGATSYIPLWNSATTLGSSVMYQSSSNIGIGTTSPQTGFKLDVNGWVVLRGEVYSSGNIIGFGSNTNYQIAETGNTWLARATGNVGIGTSSPSQKLHVSGGAFLIGNGTSPDANSGLRIVAPISTTHYNWMLAAQQNISDTFEITPSTAVGGTTFSTPVAVFNGANGRVGIGTTSPSYKLDVSGSTRTFGYLIGVDDSTTIKYIFTNDGGNSYINSGNVGIGTTSPSYKLHVVGNSVELASQPGISGYFIQPTDGRSLIRVENNSSNPSAGATGTALSLVAYSDSSSNPAASRHEAQILLGAKTSGQDGALRIIAPRDLNFYTNAQNVIMTGSAYLNYGTFAATITSGGNVGIGTTSPLSKLQVVGKTIIGDNTSYTDIVFENSASIGGYNGTHTISPRTSPGSGTAQHLTYFKNAGSPGASTVHNVSIDGNVGIGTTSPGAKLDVRGQTIITQNAAALGLIGTDHTYMEFYPSASVGRQAYFGFGSGGSKNLEIANESSIGNILLLTNSSIRAIIDSTGNVGIGTTSPSTKLEVQNGTAGADIKVSNTGGGYAQLSISSNTASTASLSFTNQLSLLGGNVGINTQSPSATLTVSKAASNYMFDLENASEANFKLRTYNSGSANGSTFPAFIYGLHYSTTENAAIRFYRGGSSTGGFLTFTTNNGTERVRIDDSGNVGIGTTSPQGILSIDEGDLRFNYGNSNTARYAYFNKKSSADGGILLSKDNTLDWQIVNSGGSGDLHVYTYGAATTAFMIKRSDGNVGINTTSPIAKLHVEQNSSFTSAGNISTYIFNTVHAIPASSTFTNGSIWSGVASTNLLSFAGASTINSGAVIAGNINVQRLGFTSAGAGSTITLTQGSGATARSIAAMQVLQQVSGSTGTISHGSGVFIQGIYPIAGGTVTFTNYYGLLINPLDEWGGVTLTNRWGIYQVGSSDNNYFAGNIGIGTTSTPAKLTVQGNISSSAAVYFKGLTTSNQSNVVTIDTATGQLYYTASSGVGGGGLSGGTTNYLARWTSATTLGIGVTYDDGTNVGIGTTSPSYKLDIVGSAVGTTAGNQSLIERLYSSTTNNDYLEITNTRVSNGSDWQSAGFRIQQKVDSTWMGYIQFNGGNNGGFSIGTGTTTTSAVTINERFRITGAGNVGINTTSPGYLLDVSAGETQARFVGSAPGYVQGSILLSSGTDNTPGYRGQGVYLFNEGTDTTWYMGSPYTQGDAFILARKGSTTSFDSSAAQYSNAFITVDNSGNTGIGTTSPSSKLHVKGDSIDNVGLTLLENDYSSGNVYYPALSVINTRGNHSYGIVAEFKISTSGDADRPSILIYGAQAAHSWQVGQVTSGWGTDDAFGIGYRASNTPSSFAAWPTNYFTILTGGNVGIGTTSPTQLLDVAGKITAGTSTYRTTIYGAANGSRITFGTPATIDSLGQLGTYNSLFNIDSINGAISFQFSGSEKVRITTDGYVGIGTTTLGSDGGVLPRLAVANPSNSDKFVGIGYDDTGEYGFIHAIHRATAWKNLAIQAFGGNVGIGTTSPSAKLDTWLTTGTGYQLVGRFLGGTNANGNAGGIALGSTQTVAGYIYGEQVASNGGDLVFGTQNGGSYTERMRILSAGNVGIGTTSPTNTLHVAGTTYVTGVFSTLGGGGSIVSIRDGSIEQQNTATDSGVLYINYFGYNGGNTYFRDLSIQNGKGSQIAFFDGSTSRVGINQGAPAYALDVSGNIHSTNAVLVDASNAAYLKGGDDHEWWDINVANTAGLYGAQNSAVGALKLGSGGGTLYGASGNIGINTTSPGYKLDVNGDTNVNGTLTATIKSFIIDHPTKKDKKLQYGVLEGPEHSVYVRGKLTRSNKITLPDYWPSLVHEDSITVNITSIGKHQDLYVQSVSSSEIVIAGSEEINCFYTVYAERKDVDKLITEF